jgi:hypothetical protein
MDWTGRSRPGKGAVAAVGLVALHAAAAVAAGAKLPEHMSFVAQEASGSWALYRVVADGSAARVPTALEPRQACLAPQARQAVYSAADGSVRRLAWDGQGEAVVATATRERGYAQPCVSGDGSTLYAVEMAEGKSIDTEIVRWPPAPAGAASSAVLVRQPGAQHDPFLHGGRWLTYASVACSDGCDRLIVEIWLRDLAAGTARQLTLFNALSRSPVTDGRVVVFSSNVSGSFELWSVAAGGGVPRQLTSGPGNALSPALCAGAVFFIESSASGSRLVRLGADGARAPVDLPAFSAIRDLRCAS